MNTVKISENLYLCGKLAIVHNKETDKWFVLDEKSAVVKKPATLAQCLLFAVQDQTKESE